MTLQDLTAAFAHEYADRPIPAEGPIDTRPIDATPDTDEFDAIWQQVIAETRARGNDFHLPLSVAYARRLCDAYPQADRELVLVATLLHDTGWAHVDEDRIISEGFRGDWRKADIRFEHELQGCEVAKRVLPGLGYSDEFIDKVTAIIEGHDTERGKFSVLYYRNGQIIAADCANAPLDFMAVKQALAKGKNIDADAAADVTTMLKSLIA